MKFVSLIVIVTAEHEEKMKKVAQEAGATGAMVIQAKGTEFEEKKSFFSLTFEGNHTILLYILEEKTVYNFDFSVLHKFIDSTVDADRLDYVNRDMLASGYITGPNDHIRITKQAVLVKQDNKFHLSFFDMSLIDIEHMLEMRFNLYKKVLLYKIHFY